MTRSARMRPGSAIRRGPRLPLGSAALGLAALALIGLGLGVPGATPLHAQPLPGGIAVPGIAEPAAGGFRAQAEEDLLDEFDAGAAEDDLLDAFGEGEDLSAEPAPAEGEPILPDWFELDGSIKLEGSYNYAQFDDTVILPDRESDVPEERRVPQRGLSKLRTTLRLDLTFTFSPAWDAQASGIAFYDAAYSIKGRDEFTQEVLDQYEEEAEPRELFVRGRATDWLDLKLGRQIVVWGFADFIRVVDVLNPQENREPGLADIEDLRLPIAMSRADLYFGPFALQGVAVHEIEFNKDPVYGSDFYPFDAPAPREDVPESTGGSTEYGTSLVGRFSGWDLGLYYADYFDDSAHFVDTDGDFVPDRLRHARLTLRGISANVAAGNWLLKAESAHISGLEFSSLPGETKARWDALLGADYFGFNDTTLTVEAVNRRVLDYDDALSDEVGEDTNQYVLSYQGDFWNQTLALNGVLTFFGQHADEGGVQRYSAAYDVVDAFTVTLGLLIFQSAGDENPLFQKVRNNDRVFFDAKYSF